MRSPPVHKATLPLVLLLTALASCAPYPREADSEARNLVGMLGSDSIDEREWAYTRLLALGSEAYSELRRGIQSSDVDIATRCQALLDHHFPHDREVRKEIAHWLRHAIRDFDRSAYEQSILLCDAILMVDSEYPVAQKLREWGEKARHVDPLYPYEGRFADWERIADPANGNLPLGETFRSPSADRWPDVRDRAFSKAVQVCRAKKEEQDQFCIKLIIEATPVTFSFKNVLLEEVFEKVRDYSGLIMIFDASNGPMDPVRRLDREFHGEKLSAVLKTLLEPLNLEYRITEEKVVLFTEPEKPHRLGR